MTSLRTLVSIALALALLVALVPTVALAADEGTSTGSFALGNDTPSIGTIQVSADPMVPQYEWTTITVPVTDLNNLSDVDEVEVQLFFDSGDADPAAPGTANVQTCAILTWDRDGVLVWDIDQGGGTTWAIDDTGCTAGDDAETTDNWVFKLKVGKVASEGAGGATNDGWDIYAKATDSQAATGEGYLRDVGMSWYGEVANVTATVSFGSVSLDDTEVQSTGAVSVTYIANGTYYQKVKTDSGDPDYAAKWVGSGANEVTLRVSDLSPAAGEIVLQADDDATVAYAVQVVQASYTMFDTGTQTDESGNTESNNYLWLSLGSGGMVADTYSGVIYYQIDNS